MTEQDALWLVTEFFGCYALGWAMGYLILVIKQTTERI